MIKFIKIMKTKMVRFLSKFNCLEVNDLYPSRAAAIAVSSV